MTVKNIEEAWKAVDEIFPTDYQENTVKSANAGYKIYDSVLGDDHGYICDLGNSLEINFPSGRSIRIWIKGNSFLDLERDTQAEISALFANWLQQYTHEVIVKVLERKEEIIGSEFALNILRELKSREDAERGRFVDSIGYMLRDPETFNKYDPHNNPLTHAESYRHILYDMYIAKD